MQQQAHHVCLFNPNHAHTHTRHFSQEKKQLCAYPQTHSASEDTIRMRLLNEGRCHKSTRREESIHALQLMLEFSSRGWPEIVFSNNLREALEKRQHEEDLRVLDHQRHDRGTHTSGYQNAAPLILCRTRYLSCDYRVACESSLLPKK